MYAKRSNTRKLPKRSFTLLLDENTSSPIIVVQARKLPGWTIEMQQDHFPRATADEEVVALCGRNGWGLVTSDEMRYTPETMLAIFAWGVRHFKLTGQKNTHFVRKQAALCMAQDRIGDLILGPPGALCAHVHQTGLVKVMSRFEKHVGVYSESQLRTVRKFGVAALSGGMFEAPGIA